MTSPCEKLIWDYIDALIRVVAVPVNAIGIEGTLITKGGFAHYDVINFTYPDGRIGGYLDTKLWFAYVRNQNQLLVPGEDNPQLRGIRILLIMRKLVKNLSGTHLLGSVQSLQVDMWGGERCSDSSVVY